MRDFYSRRWVRVCNHYARQKWGHNSVKSQIVKSATTSKTGGDVIRWWFLRWIKPQFSETCGRKNVIWVIMNKRHRVRHFLICEITIQDRPRHYYPDLFKPFSSHLMSSSGRDLTLTWSKTRRYCFANKKLARLVLAAMTPFRCLQKNMQYWKNISLKANNHSKQIF